MASLFGPGYQNRYGRTPTTGTNPWATYATKLGSGNYPGSSGYWGGPAIPGRNPGDAAREALMRQSGLPVPGNGGDSINGPGFGAGLPGQGQKPLNPQDFLGQYQLPSRNPGLSTQTANTLSDVGAADKQLGLPHFDDLKKQFTAGTGDVNNWYNRYQAGNDISGFAATQRAADAEASRLTGQYADTARGILGEAKDVTDRYRTEGLGALDKVTANAQDFYNKDIPASIADAQARAVNYTSRYGMGRGGGLGSDIGVISGRAATQAALPFQLQGRQFIGNALERYQPFYGDVASRDYSRVAGLNLPTESNIYGAQVGDVMRSKATEQQIQSLDMLVKERGLNAAVENLKRQGLPETLVNDLVAQWQRLKGGNLQLAGQAAGLEQQYGAERGYYDRYGAPVAQPQYPGLPRPSFPNPYPGRYDYSGSSVSPSTAATGPSGVPGVDPLADANARYAAERARLGAAFYQPPRYANTGAGFNNPSGNV